MDENRLYDEIDYLQGRINALEDALSDQSALHNQQLDLLWAAIIDLRVLARGVGA